MNIRSGTLNVPNIVGFGKAVTLAKKEFVQENIRYAKWFNKLTAEFQKINGHPKNRLLHNINVYPGSREQGHYKLFTWPFLQVCMLHI